MAINMPRRTAMSTRTQGVVGIKPRARPTTPRATREPTLLLLAAMEARKRAAGHRLLVEAAAVGNPGRTVLVVRKAAVVAAAGVVADEVNDEVTFSGREFAD